MKEINLNCNLHNRFDVEVRDAKTGKIKKQAYAENIILDAFFSRLLNIGTLYNNMHSIQVGSGSGELSSARESLFAYLPAGAKAVTFEKFENHAKSGYLMRRVKIVFSEVELVGTTLTEVGLATGTTSTALVTHAALKDMNGNTVSLLKTATDVITVYATLYVNFSASGWENGTLKIIPCVHTEDTSTSRSQYLNGLPSAWYYSLEALLLGSNFARPFALQFSTLKDVLWVNPNPLDVAAYPGIDAIYIIPTKTVDLVNKKIALHARLPVEKGNVYGGIRSVSLYPLIFIPNSQSNFPGSAIIGESLGTGDGSEKDFKTMFPNTKNSKVYVDGVEEIGVTVDHGLPWNNDLVFELNVLEKYSTPAISSLLLGKSNSLTASLVGDYIVFENPHYASYGIDSIYTTLEILTSDDLANWESIIPLGAVGAKAVPSAHRNKRYWKALRSGSAGSTNYGALSRFISNDLADGENVHFNTAPPVGAAITIDYETPIVAKDVDHVFDCTLTLQFGEFTP